ncbi:class I SAM-dependent methyltransferase [Sphingomonas sp. Leaf226]|uniref:class I SAM-dependent methyltransferase n=1 Tax=Sphingomonas sp. Leaf226 TaxID=1735691 RepID=UPI0009E8E1B2|nr:class I SAM-dependent methyltransferase [Sphingomonas sp. Leaf226]
MIRNLASKNPRDIYAEWDALAPIRLKQIISGNDLTFKHILSPLIQELAFAEPGSDILDLGCGVGVLTEQLANMRDDAVGVDPSAVSIQIAREMFSSGVLFHRGSAEWYASATKKRFSVIVANMVLMDALDLRAFVKSVSILLRRGGAFIFSITHPCFWPDYYGYADKEWFNYKEELIVESPFKISNQQDCRLNSTHVHRPIEMYISAFTEQGLVLDGMFEPLPSKAVNKLYPNPWTKPRYLVGRCRLPKKV